VNGREAVHAIEKFLPVLNILILVGLMPLYWNLSTVKENQAILKERSAHTKEHNASVDRALIRLTANIGTSETEDVRIQQQLRGIMERLRRCERAHTALGQLERDH